MSRNNYFSHHFFIRQKKKVFMNSWTGPYGKFQRSFICRKKSWTCYFSNSRIWLWESKIKKSFQVRLRNNKLATYSSQRQYNILNKKVAQWKGIFALSEIRNFVFVAYADEKSVWLYRKLTGWSDRTFLNRQVIWVVRYVTFFSERFIFALNKHCFCACRLTHLRNVSLQKYNHPLGRP